MLYHHEGGMQMNLLYSNGTKLKRLVPDENASLDYFDGNMSQQQNASVTFEQPCSSCILQLLKQAEDLKHGFVFVSCADIEVITSREDSSRRNDETECQVAELLFYF
jgi:hypothetical protein